MSATTATTATTATRQAARFEAVWLAGGWTVVDLLSETAILPRRAWDEAAAALVTDALNASPAYAVHFRWSEPDSYPIQRWDVLAAPVRAQTPDGSAVAELPAGTSFDAFSDPDNAGRVEIAAFAPGDAGGESCRLWLVDERELWAAAARMAGDGAAA